MPFSKTLVAHDFSNQAEIAALRSRLLARALQAELHLVHAIPLQHHALIYGSDASAFKPQFEIAQQRMEQLVSDLRVDGLQVSGECIQRSPAETIVQVAKRIGIDLIVVESHGHSGWQLLSLGSIAERVLHIADRPVLVVRGTREPVHPFDTSFSRRIFRITPRTQSGLPSHCVTQSRRGSISFMRSISSNRARSSSRRPRRRSKSGIRMRVSSSTGWHEKFAARACREQKSSWTATRRRQSHST